METAAIAVKVICHLENRMFIMLYVTGIHALNLPCALQTCGDWHQSVIQWHHPRTKDSETAFFGSYGIETGHHIPEHDGEYAVANTIRALLDLLYGA